VITRTEDHGPWPIEGSWKIKQARWCMGWWLSARLTFENN